MLAYARVLIKVSIDQTFPNEIQFVYEKGVLTHQSVKYVCKLVKCIDYGGFGHNMEKCRKKRVEIA